MRIGQSLYDYECDLCSLPSTEFNTPRNLDDHGSGNMVPGTGQAGGVEALSPKQTNHPTPTRLVLGLELIHVTYYPRNSLFMRGIFRSLVGGAGVCVVVRMQAVDKLDVCVDGKEHGNRSAPISISYILTANTMCLRVRWWHTIPSSLSWRV